MTRRAMVSSRSESVSPSKNASESFADKVVTWWMFSPPIVTARIAGLRRAPPQVLHGMTAMYSSSLSLTLSLSDSLCRRMTLDSAPS